jgi:hypothetical protein
LPRCGVGAPDIGDILRTPGEFSDQFQRDHRIAKQIVSGLVLFGNDGSIALVDVELRTSDLLSA